MRMPCGSKLKVVMNKPLTGLLLLQINLIKYMELLKNGDRNMGTTNQRPRDEGEGDKDSK